MSDGASSLVCGEEVVEDGGVKGADSLLAEIVIVGLDFRAAVVVGVLDEALDHVGILAAELSQVLVLSVEGVVLEGGDEAIKLLLLVSLTVLLHDDGASEVLQEVSAETYKSLIIASLGKISIDSAAIVISALVVLEVLDQRAAACLVLILKRANEGVILSLG